MTSTELRYRLIFTGEQLGNTAADIVVFQSELCPDEDERADALGKASRYLELARRELCRAVHVTPARGPAAALALSITNVQARKQCGAVGADVVPFRGSNNNAG